ncbi:MAG: RNA polymerase sigma factor [Fluviibacter sp.]
MATPRELDAFLADVERRAYKTAWFAVHNEENALDIVQDTMLKLAENYGDRPTDELPALFQRILQNTIRDFYRRSKVRNLWTTLFSALGGGEDEDDQEKIDRLRAADAEQAERPEQALEQRQILNDIEESLAKLPARQREAFLLRYWEGLDTAETAEAMGCSQGSVKTHCSRATQTLAAALKEKGHQL